MPMTTINIRRFSGVLDSPVIKHWYLDEPAPGTNEASGQNIKVRGWVVPQPGHNIERVVIEHSGKLEEFGLLEKRADVARRFNALGVGEVRSDRCGFNFYLSPKISKFKLGYKTNSAVIWSASVEIITTLKVEHGRDGWLFLGNDTNRSMEQFAGRRLLSNQEVLLWEEYFGSIQNHVSKKTFRSCFLLAPAKEFCLAEYYPVERGAWNAIDQFLELFQKGNNIVWPCQELTEDKEQTYWKGDTHWSDYGAYVAARRVLEALGITPAPEVSTARYSIMKRAGDLGGKLSPPKTFAVATADFTAANEALVFDNQIHNHGRIRIYESRASKNSDLTCVCFGDSFSVNLVPWLSPYFRRLVYVHSAAAPDDDLLAAERPTHVVFQTNSRFIIIPPKVTGNLKASVAAKLGLLSNEKRNALAIHLREQLSKPSNNVFYLQFMLTMIESINPSANT